jgi:hypothetical protein
MSTVLASKEIAMISLRAFAFSIGITSSEISLLDIAQQVLPGGSTFSIQTMVQAGSGSPDPTNENFMILPIDLEGSGEYRANRFRIYFQAPFGQELSIPNLVFELGRIFTQVFNGFGPEVSGEGLEQNIAVAHCRPDKPFNGEDTLQFEFDIRVLFNHVNFPDVHDDWVGFVHQDPNLGFAVQTLKRQFIQANDAGFGIGVAEVLGALGFLVVNIFGGLAVAAMNRYHFLSGRRSWIIAKDTDARGPNFANAHPISSELQNLLDNRTRHTYVLETAAIERFSSWVVNLASVPGIGLGDIDQLLATIWTILLRNFVETNQFSVEIPTSDDIIRPTFGQSLRGVTWIQQSFGSKEECLAQDWVQDLLALHPGIADQF